MPRSERHPSTAPNAVLQTRSGAWLGLPVAHWMAVTLLLLLTWSTLALVQRQSAVDRLARGNALAAAGLAAELGSDAASVGQTQVRLAGLAAGGQFDVLRWTDAAGGMFMPSRAAAVNTGVPVWFMRLAPFEPAAGIAVLTLDDRRGELQVRLSSVPAWQALWQDALTAAWVLTIAGALAIAGLGRARHARLRALAQLVLQLRAVRTGEAAASAPPIDPLLRPLVRAVAQVAAQRAALLAAHAEQMEALRRHAHVDPVTGLPNRRAFVAELAELLADDAPGQHAAGLVLLRVRDLHGLNLRLSHERCDELLRGLADLLRAYPRQVGGALLGRLNGADFALVLPVAGQALGTAQSLLAALRPLLAPLDAGAGAAIGAVELSRPVAASDALALADEALARAEIGGRFALEVVGQALQAPVGGEAEWPQRLRRALDDGRVQLAEQPLCTADGRLLALDCPLRLQLEDAGVFVPASRWLALAARSRLVADVDERAVELALRAIGRDGSARCVHVAAASLATPGFVDRVARQLAKAPACAFRLWLDVAEATARDHPELVRDAATRWRATGALVALEHAGDTVARRPQLLDLGLDCLRIDARYIDGAGRADGEGARRYLRALVHLAHGVGLQVTADGVGSAADLALLWSLGFDAASGAAVDGESTNETATGDVDLPLDLDLAPPARADNRDVAPA